MSCFQSCLNTHVSVAQHSMSIQPFLEKGLDYMSNAIHEKLIRISEESNWEYAPHDLVALDMLKSRIAETGKRFGLISYSDLVMGVDFHYPNINNGHSYRITIYDWTGLDRKIIGDCLGYISMESYKQAGFMASALVISRLESKPSDIFFEWMEYLNVLPDTREDTVLRFWSEQVHYAHQWFKYGRKAPEFIE